MKGWELDEYRNGRWYTLSRNFAANAYEDYSRWQVMNAYTHRVTKIRAIADDSVPLLDGALSLEPEDTGDTTMARLDDAKTDGYKFATAMSAVFQVNTSDMAPVFTLGRHFAKFAGYADSDGAFAYIEGFVNGIQKTATPALTAPQE